MFQAWKHDKFSSSQAILSNPLYFNTWTLNRSVHNLKKKKEQPGQQKESKKFSWKLSTDYLETQGKEHSQHAECSSAKPPQSQAVLTGREYCGVWD